MFEAVAFTCEIHGEVQGQKIPYINRVTCPACDEERRQREHAAHAAHQAEMRAQLRADRVHELVAVSGLRGRFADCTFDRFEPHNADAAEALRRCKQFAEKIVGGDNEGEGLFLIGPPGTGKTHLGAAMVRHVIEAATCGAAIHSARDVVRTLRATWAKGAAETEDAAIRRLGSLPLLVLDEVGVGFGTEAETVQLFDVVDMRYQLRRPTVVASNLNIPMIKAAVGDRIFDRLREGAATVRCDWPSRRGGRA